MLPQGAAAAAPVDHRAPLPGTRPSNPKPRPATAFQTAPRIAPQTAPQTAPGSKTGPGGNADRVRNRTEARLVGQKACQSPGQKRDRAHGQAHRGGRAVGGTGPTVGATSPEDEERLADGTVVGDEAAPGIPGGETIEVAAVAEAAMADRR